MRNPKVLVIGDFIEDYYRFFTCSRLCPEAPVPVLVQQGKNKLMDGGAGLVSAQLREFLGDHNVISVYGSRSRKERIFADGKLICRVDQDRKKISNQKVLLDLFHEYIPKVDLVIVSDYGKGAMTEISASIVMALAARQEIPVLVDAKNNWHWYNGAYAFFPNKHEYVSSLVATASHIIQKLGPDGCDVDRVNVPPGNPHEVRDVTGAGDIFLAAFAVKMLELGFPNQAGVTLPEDVKLQTAARFANLVAGVSIEHIGTYVVKFPSGSSSQPQ